MGEEAVKEAEVKTRKSKVWERDFAPSTLSSDASFWD